VSEQTTAKETCRCRVPVAAMECEATYRLGEDGLPIGTGMRVRRYCSECGKDLPR
jgi:hypothetical protein